MGLDRLGSSPSSISPSDGRRLVQNFFEELKHLVEIKWARPRRPPSLLTLDTNE